MNNLTVNILDIYGLEIVGRYVGLPVNKVLVDAHPDPRHIPSHKLKTLTKLIAAGDEHAKIMRQVHAHLEITAPRYWWTQFVTYESGCEKYSGSTMHTLMKHRVTEDDFTDETSPVSMDTLRRAISWGGLSTAKANLPEGYLQTRLILVSYQTLRRIWLQRRGHKLPEWAEFLGAIEECPYANQLIFVEPRNPWRDLWERVLDLGSPYPADEDGTETDYCFFCGYKRPGHESTCPYTKALVLEQKGESA